MVTHGGKVKILPQLCGICPTLQSRTYGEVIERVFTRSGDDLGVRRLLHMR